MAIDMLWITAGLSCAGDSVSITGASQPSVEDLVLGAIPGVPEPERLIDPDTDEVAVELSPAVTASISPAIDLVRDLLARIEAGREPALEVPCTS